jgi:hypothetical protein
MNKFYLGLIFLFIFIWIISQQIQECMLEDDPHLQTIKSLLQEAFPNDEDIQNLKLYKGDKSYTLNKEKVFLCMKDEKGDYYPTNMLVYVLLHEIAHVKNDEIGHGEKFQQIFDVLLKQAKANNLYDDTIPIIPNYCP